jgi:hypothetical protein
MTDTFAGGFVVAIIAVLLAAAVVGWGHALPQSRLLHCLLLIQAEHT